jgi:stress-induced morphogen
MLAALTHSLRASRRNLTSLSSFPRYSSSTAAPDTTTEGEDAILQKLTKRFSPSQLKVQDISGACRPCPATRSSWNTGGCGTFYAIVIASAAFKDLPTVKQHKLVTETLKSEIEGIHGLQVLLTFVLVVVLTVMYGRAD